MRLHEENQCETDDSIAENADLLGVSACSLRWMSDIRSERLFDLKADPREDMRQELEAHQQNLDCQQHLRQLCDAR